MQRFDVDVVIIGAGIIGASCADQLTRRGRSVVVLEGMEAPGLGSTARSNACVRSQWRDPTNIALSWYSIQRYRDFAAIYGTDVGYRPIGYLILHGEDQWESQLRAVEIQRDAGVPVEVLTPAQAQRTVAFDPAAVAGVTWGPTDGRIDAHLATSAFLEHAKQREARIVVSSPVRSVTEIGTRWAVVSDRARVTADVLVNAAGGWSGDVAALAGLTVPVTHSRRMLFSSAPGQRTDLPMVQDTTSGFFIRSEGDRFIMGFGGEHEPDGYNNSLDWAWLESVMEAGHERFPWILELPMDQRASWAGTYDLSPDHLPFVGRMPGVDNWVNVCGFSGHGVMQAPAVGRAVAEEIVDGAAHSIDVNSLRIERLAAGVAVAKDLVF
jgi:sarcosine oxidase subunit beta